MCSFHDKPHLPWRFQENPLNGPMFGTDRKVGISTLLCLQDVKGGESQ